MKHDDIAITSLKGQVDNMNVYYSDDDIAIIDSTKELSQRKSNHLQLNIIVACSHGYMHAMVNGVKMELHESQMLICPPGTVIDKILVSPDFEFKAILSTSRIIQSFLHEKYSLWTELFYIHHMHVVTMDSDEILFLVRLGDLLKPVIDSHHDTLYRTDIIQSILRTFFLGICATLEKRRPDVTPPKRTYADSLFDRFLELLSQHKKKDFTVEMYANELCVSPKYLSEICKKNSGKTANLWIREQMLEEIRYYLKQTDLSVKQISERLGFANPSFLGKYVKEHFGMSPIQYRQSRT